MRWPFKVILIALIAFVVWAIYEDSESKTKRAHAAAQNAAVQAQSELQRAIVERRVVVGMTVEQAVAAWGRPERRDRTDMDGLTVECLYWSGARLAIVSDGKVSSVSYSTTP